MHKFFAFLILVLVFAVGFFSAQKFLSGQWAIIREQISSLTKSPQPVVQNRGCDETCQKEIENRVNSAVASLSGNIRATNTSSVPVSVKPQDSYITIPGSGSTISTDWVSLDGTDFSFDTVKDFEHGANFSWEGFLRVANANGTAYARIFDVTHGIAVSPSEISVTNSADYTRVVSGNLNFWSGRNVYRIQVKSLNSLKVDYMGGKIRVSY